MPWDNNRRTHVPKKIRDQALERDGHRCTATLRNGTRCPETAPLEIHEPQGYQGRPPTIEEVATLCAWHHNRITQAQAAANRTRLPTNRPTPRHPGLKP